MRKGSNKVKTRTIQTFHHDTISIPDYEMIRVLESKLAYSKVIRARDGEVLGTPDMDVVRKTMRPVTDPACRERGEYYIANWK